MEKNLRFEFTVGAQGESVKMVMPFELSADIIQNNFDETLKNMLREYATTLADNYADDLISIYKPL